jgi:hypothetical protein
MPNQTPKPLNIEKLTLPLSAIQAMESAQRSALLLLGLFLNELSPNLGDGLRDQAAAV